MAPERKLTVSIPKRISPRRRQTEEIGESSSSSSSTTPEQPQTVNGLPTAARVQQPQPPAKPRHLINRPPLRGRMLRLRGIQHHSNHAVANHCVTTVYGGPRSQRCAPGEFRFQRPIRAVRITLLILKRILNEYYYT